MHLNGRSVIITGAAGGIGRAIAMRLLKENALVTLSDIDHHKLAQTMSELEDRYPDKVTSLAGDAADESYLQRLLYTAEQKHGPTDIFFANAGISGARGIDAPDSAWEQTFTINLMAHVRAARSVIPGWLERGEGYFISTASAAGLLTQLGSATYSVTKHATISFAEWLAVSYGSKGIRVSCLCPMGVDTDLLRAGNETNGEASRLASRAVASAGPILSPTEVAESVIEAINGEQFLILPHPEVLKIFQNKSNDYDRWIRGMQRYADKLK